jgi:hypothetical protein
MNSNYTVGVEADEMSLGRYKIVIRDSAQMLHGTPVRNITNKEAHEMLFPIKFAFEYGVRAHEQSHHGIFTHINTR